MFALYLAWDIITKVVIYLRDKRDEGPSERRERAERHYWLRNYGSRMAPTVACLILAGIIWSGVRTSDRQHYFTADLALLSLVLLFRSLKDLVSIHYPHRLSVEKKPRRHAELGLWIASGIYIVVIGYGAFAMTRGWQLPIKVGTQIDDQIRGTPTMPTCETAIAAHVRRLKVQCTLSARASE